MYVLISKDMAFAEISNAFLTGPDISDYKLGLAGITVCSHL